MIDFLPGFKGQSRDAFTALITAGTYSDQGVLVVVISTGSGNSSVAMSEYRYGFNGQEKSDEIAGEGNHNTAEFWEYDSRIGRRWNLDPKPNMSISNYAAFENTPILHYDVLGDTTRPAIFIEYESIYKDVYKADLEYSTLPGNERFSLKLPVLNWTVLLFNYEPNRTKQNKNRDDTRAKNGGMKGARADKTAAHEVAYAMTKQGGNNSNTIMRIVDASLNSSHGSLVSSAASKAGSQDGDPLWIILIPAPEDLAPVVFPIVNRVRDQPPVQKYVPSPIIVNRP